MRKVEKDRYIAAGVITIFIFLMGMLVGLITDIQKVNYAESIVQKQDVEFESLQLQYLYLQYLPKNEVCPVITKILENNLKTLQPILEKLIEYEENNKRYGEEYEFLKRKYILANIRYFILAEKSRKECDADIVTVLYFYNKNCEVCPTQGFILSHLKSILRDRLLVFPFDVSYTQEPMVGVLATQYNVSVFPTLIINGHERVVGFRTEKELLEIICPLYRNKPPICEGVER